MRALLPIRFKAKDTEKGCFQKVEKSKTFFPEIKRKEERRENLPSLLQKKF